MSPANVLAEKHTGCVCPTLISSCKVHESRFAVRRALSRKKLTLAGSREQFTSLRRRISAAPFLCLRSALQTLPILIWPCLLVYSAHIKNAPAFRSLSPWHRFRRPPIRVDVFFSDAKSNARKSFNATCKRIANCRVINGGYARLSFTQRMAICQQNPSLMHTHQRMPCLRN